MRTIVAGDRRTFDLGVVTRAINASRFKLTEVVCGGAPGIDAAGYRWARNRGVPVVFFHADWAALGRLAGPARNEEMAVYADALVAIPGPESRGTYDMIERAHSHGLEVFVSTELIRGSD